MIEIRSSHPEAFHRQHLERFGVHSQREPRRLHRQGRPGHDDRLFARLAKRIRVNEVRPGIIATDMTARVKDQYDRRIADGLTPIRRWGAGGRGTGGTRLAGPTSISPPPWPSTSMAGSICTGCKTPDQGLMTKTIRAIRKLGPEPSDPFHRRSVRVGPDVLIRWRPRASAAPTSTSIAGTSGASTIKPPLTLGHEFAGTVVELGDAVENVRVGDFVSAESHITCGMCFQCRTGQAHMCPHTKILGVDRDGAFAEFVSVPSSVIWRNDRTKMPPEIATLQEPFGNAVFATLAHEMPGQSVAVFGAAPSGSSRSPSPGHRAPRNLCERHQPVPPPARKEDGRGLPLQPQGGEPWRRGWFLEHNEVPGRHRSDVGSPENIANVFRVVRNGRRVSLFSIAARWSSTWPRTSSSRTSRSWA